MYGLFDDSKLNYIALAGIASSLCLYFYLSSVSEHAKSRAALKGKFADALADIEAAQYVLGTLTDALPPTDALPHPIDAPLPLDGGVDEVFFAGDDLAFEIEEENYRLPHGGA